MRRVTIFLIVICAIPRIAFAQAQSPSRSTPKSAADRLGMTCAQVLKMPSADWIAYFRDKAPAPTSDAAVSLTRATAVYGKCYDARTDALAATLAKSGTGPTKAARADFAAFEAALKDFAAKALAVAQVSAPPAADSQKAAYASLYEKQFRYQFYQEYEAKAVRSAKPAPPAAKPPASAAGPPPAANSPAAAAATAQERALSDSDPVTTAKNRFGKILEVLPEDKMHDLHRAFGEVIGPHQISEAMRLAVYRYAIFILEPPSATPFSPPPF